MARFTDTEAAYFAGLFDGEGCVQAYINNKGPRNSRNGLEMRLTMSNADPEPLEILVEVIGGSISLKALSKRNPRWADNWLWRISGINAEEFAKEILPYSIIKHAQLEMWLELRSFVARGFRQFTKEELRERESLVQRIGGAK